MDDDQQKKYQRSWDSFIDAYGALMEKHEQVLAWASRAAERLEKAPKTVINQLLTEEWKTNGKSWRSKTSAVKQDTEA